jgi:hypothetical protein
MTDDHAESPEVQPPRRRSFGDVVVDLVTSPAELFEDVRLNPVVPTKHWLIPLVTFVLVQLVMGQLIVRNDSLADQLGATIRRGFDRQVEAGKMTQEQADQVYEQFARPGSTMFMISGAAASVLGTPIVLFALGLVYWLLCKWILKGAAPYMKVVEVVGLVFIISILESIVTTFLIFAMNSVFATPSLGIFISDYSLTNKFHIAMSKINVFTVWSLAVISIGLSKIMMRQLAKVAPLVFGAWVAWVALSLATGFGAGM